ncbi:MAG: hypothetical protein KBA96_10625 [Rhodocyclaceae bacterium]|nr:hypothetical protein [Rhodocyclaceae bacterium]
MTMKPTDLQKHLGLKINGKMGASGIPNRFGNAAGLGDKREQRERDRALGLVPFACKLPSELVAKLQALSASEAGGINGLTAKLLESALIIK